MTLTRRHSSKHTNTRLIFQTPIHKDINQIVDSYIHTDSLTNIPQHTYSYTHTYTLSHTYPQKHPHTHTHTYPLSGTYTQNTHTCTNTRTYTCASILLKSYKLTCHKSKHQRCFSLCVYGSLATFCMCEKYT